MRAKSSALSGFALSACVLLAPGTAGGSEPLQTAYGGGELLLTAAGEGVRLGFPGGRTLELPLPEGGEVSALVAAEGGWVLAGSFAAEDGRRRLFLRAGDEGGARRLPAPGGQRGRARVGAVLLVERGRLAGAAWLEGDGAQRLAVKASRWSEGGWRAPETVAAPGPGSQIALCGAVLADGSWLLAWSAFDGEDDEVVWTRRVGDTWSPVERLGEDNRVPDITPALSAAGDGALAAWSLFDGNDYRLVVARFSDGAWAPAEMAGGPGSLYPRFVGGGDSPRLLHLSARPAGWTVLELDRRGRVARRTAVATERLDRPVVEVAGGRVELSWPGGGGGTEAPLREVDR